MRWLFLLLTLVAVPLIGQAPSEPVLTEIQKKDIQIALQAVELWQLKAQLASSEFEKARTHVNELITRVTPTGYQLNDKLEFVKLPPK